MSKHLWDGDIFEHKGRKYRVRFEHDDSHGAPWEECDGHGVVSDWTTRDKAPGERVLASDRSSKRYYDVCETAKIAKKDGWGLGNDELAKLAQSLGRMPTKKEIVARAVDNDFEYMRAWCNGEWHYCGVVVSHCESDETESLWGIEDNEYDYLAEVARELADEISSRLDDIMAQEIQESRPDMVPCVQT
jgi:hypothetical protein